MQLYKSIMQTFWILCAVLLFHLKNGLGELKKEEKSGKADWGYETMSMQEATTQMRTFQVRKKKSKCG